MPSSSRHIVIQTSLGSGKLLLRRFHCCEQLGRPFRIEAEALSLDHDIVLDKLVGEPACISLELGTGKHRYFHGIVSAFSQENPVGRFASYRMTIVPWLWFLTRTSDCRIFQEKTVPEILKSVFKEYGFTGFDDQLKGVYKPWTYCVQYRESDFNFVSRLMEQEGIYYYWSHTEKQHILVLVDAGTSHHPYPGYEKIVFRHEHEGFSGGGDISSWSLRQQLQPGIFAVTDYNFQKPKASLQAKKAQSKQKAGKKWEVFDYPGEYDEHGEGESYARLRIEELQVPHEVMSGISDSRGIAVGHQFTLDRHPRKDQNRKHLVIAVDYHVVDEQYESGEGTFDLSCTFNAIPATQPFRSARITPKPIIQGPQTAIVTGPSGEEIYVDEYGRVKVQFHWDRYGKRDQNSSCWIRTSHPWAGKGFGGMAVPRIGQEVIVEFLEGDPDQPIINGRIYNADSMPHSSNAGRKTPAPANLRQAAMMTSLKSNSLGGSGGHNEITMNDTGGAETLFFKAQKDEIHTVGHDRDDTVTHDEKRKVGNDRDDTVTHDERRKVGNDRTRDVGKNETVKIGVNQDITVGTNQTEKIGVSQSLTVGTMRTQQVMVAENVMTGMIKSCQTGVAYMDIVGVARAEITGVARFTMVGVTDKLVVTGGRSETVGKDRTITVKKNSLIEATENNSIKAGKDAFLEAGANCGIKAASMMVIECPDITLQAGGSFIRIDSSGVTIYGAIVNINSGGSPGSLPAPPKPSVAPAAPPAADAAGSGSAAAGSAAADSAAGGAAGAAAGVAGKAADSPFVGALKDLGIGENTAKMLDQIVTDPTEIKMDQITSALPSAKELINQIPAKILPNDVKAALGSVTAMATGTPEEAEAARKALVKQAEDKAKAELRKRIQSATGLQTESDKSGGEDGSGNAPAVTGGDGQKVTGEKSHSKPPSPKTKINPKEN